MPTFVPASLLLFASATTAMACDGASADALQLASRTWLTTAVYEGDDRVHNRIAQYPGVVGISIWDACRNRFEYFDPTTGRSRQEQGGAGWFFFTSDRRFQLTVPDAGAPLVRRLEVMSATEFTYSRQVPRGLVHGQPSITLHVVHTPYEGGLTILRSPFSQQP